MFLGIEIGGTKLQMGAGSGDGTLAALWRTTVDPARGSEGIREQIATGLDELLATSTIERSQLRGAGIGFGGPIDMATQTIIKSHQIEGWDNFSLASWAAEVLGVPVAIGNDADVAGLGEALFGAGQGLSPIFYMTIGSGIGGGLIINGEIYGGSGKGAAEVGHLKLPGYYIHDPNLPRDIDEAIVEHAASGWAIQRAARAAIQEPQYSDSLLANTFRSCPEKMMAQDVGEAAAQGDPLAKEILRRAWSQLAIGICHVIALLCPRRIVIGGGVSFLGEDLFFRPLRTLVADQVFRPFADCYEIVPAALGEEVVIHGALALAKSKIER